jgi:hypothetical protein
LALGLLSAAARETADAKRMERNFICRRFLFSLTSGEDFIEIVGPGCCRRSAYFGFLSLPLDG